MTNISVAVKPSNQSSFKNFSLNDLKALAAIKKITGNGHNAEVKEKNGSLIVYDVDKKIAI